MKSKNFSLCISLAILLFEISAFASTTRTRSMGDVGLVLRDQSNIWLFPSTMVRYQNLAILELGGQRELVYYLPAQAGFDPSGGGLIGFGADNRHVIGGFVGESSERLPFAPSDPITGQPLAMNRRLDLYRNLTVDFSLDPDYFKRGVYVLSGSEGKMFNLVTVTYGFE